MRKESDMSEFVCSKCGAENELDVKQAADLFGITVHAIRQRIKTARKRGDPIPFHRVGVVGTGKLYASKSALVAWQRTFERAT